MRPADISDGYYRLLNEKGEGTHVLFSARETPVEVRFGRIRNLMSGRSCGLDEIGRGFVLIGPLQGPFDLRPSTCFQRFHLCEPDSR